METLKVGDYAYLDSFAGLVPCKVYIIDGPSGMASTLQTITVRLTANRRAYKRGEWIKENGLHVVPRVSVRFRKYSAHIVPYQVENSTDSIKQQ